ncbi:MAG: putative NADH-quinone oxidoreductase subunit [Planctomycetota bacterium]
MNPTDQLASAPLMPFYVAAAIAAAGLLLVLRPGRAAMRRAGAVIGLAGFGMLMAQGLKLAGPSDGSVSTPFYMAFAAIGIIGAVRVITHPRPVFAAIYFVLTVLAAGGIFLMLQAEFLAFALIIVYAGAILITYMFVLMLAHQSPEDEIGRIGAEDYDRIPREPLVATLLGFFLMASLGSVIERAPELAMENAAIAQTRATTDRAAALQKLPNTMLQQAKAKEPTATRLARDAGGLASATDGAMVQVRVNAEGDAVRTVQVNPADAVDNVQMVGLDLVAKYPASLELAGVILLMAMFGAVVLARRQIELGDDERRKAAGMGSMVLDVPETERGGA